MKRFRQYKKSSTFYVQCIDTGPPGYTAHILDGIVDKLVRRIFERMKAVSKSEIVNVRYHEKMKERKALLRTIRAADDEGQAIR